MKRFAILYICLFFIAVCCSQNNIKSFFDVTYAQTGNTKLFLDIYLPNNLEAPDLVVWIHGGSWISGDKKHPPLAFVKKGYALASINYRLSKIAKFPAQIHDVKAAIRFLRAKASEYGYNANKIVVMGSSAGGHLAVLAGVTNNQPEFEGTVGNYLSTTSEVHGMVDFYGPTNFMTVINQSTKASRKSRLAILIKLFGVLPDKKPALATMASPVFQVDKTDPPLLIFHGNKDLKVPINQSLELENAYKKHHLEVDFKIVYGGGHGGKAFGTKDNYALIYAFLDKIFR